MTEAHLRRTRVAIAAGIAAWLVVALIVAVRISVVAALVGVGWGGSILVSAAACLERAIVKVGHGRRTRPATLPDLAEQPVAA